MSLPFLHVPEGCSLTAFATESRVCEPRGKDRHVPEPCAGLDLGVLGASPLRGWEPIQNVDSRGPLQDEALSASLTSPECQGRPSKKGSQAAS